MAVESRLSGCGDVVPDTAVGACPLEDVKMTASAHRFSYAIPSFTPDQTQILQRCELTAACCCCRSRRIVWAAVEVSPL